MLEALYRRNKRQNEIKKREKEDMHIKEERVYMSVCN